MYAVPAYSPVGTYAEWYWDRSNFGVEGMDGEPKFDIRNSDAVRAFHLENYGVDFHYHQFAAQFRAELFDPDEWATIFAESGARYVVLTSKHHDGFALWPSREADETWGRPWNAVSAGPRRDLAGDLVNAVRDKGLKMGFYYSLYEWYNPLYLSDFDAYVDQHMHPQFKDLVTRYRPSVIFADGEWGNTSQEWRSEELLAWLFAQDNADDVVINDRWGSETRHQHGGYFTTEYGAGLPDASHPWEESRGMGTSYGYNRNESLSDYSTSRRLILTLIDTVSRGGNLLLNVGPTADGRIPVIMQDRLHAIGQWLHVNGESIYGTRPWVRAVQWGEGEVPQFGVKAHGFVDYDIIAQTVSPPPGQARKEIFFTQRDCIVYAIVPSFPDESLTIRDLALSDDANVTLLGHDAALKWRQSGNDVVVEVPAVGPGDIESTEAFVFRLVDATNCTGAHHDR